MFVLGEDFVFTLTGGLAALLGVDADDEGGDPAIAMGDGACFGIILDLCGHVVQIEILIIMYFWTLLFCLADYSLISLE